MAARAGSEKSIGQRTRFQGNAMATSYPPVYAARHARSRNWWGAATLRGVAQEFQQRPLRPVQALRGRELLDGLEVPREDLPAREPTQDRRRDVRRLAHGWGVAELGSGRLDGGHDHAMRVGAPGHRVLRVAGELAGADERAGPGAEILGGIGATHHLADVRVDVAPPDVDDLPLLVHE